jgi:hypothetical protein
VLEIELESEESSSSKLDQKIAKYEGETGEE